MNTFPDLQQRISTDKVATLNYLVEHNLGYQFRMVVIYIIEAEKIGAFNHNGEQWFMFSDHDFSYDIGMRNGNVFSFSFYGKNPTVSM